MRLFGKAFRLPRFPAVVGEWQMHEPRLLPQPVRPDQRSVVRGRLLFEDPQVGCVSCHPRRIFAKKRIPRAEDQALPAMRAADESATEPSTLTGKNYEDSSTASSGLGPMGLGPGEERQGQYTVFPLRGLWGPAAGVPPTTDGAQSAGGPPVRPATPPLRPFKYEPLFGGRSRTPQSP